MKLRNRTIDPEFFQDEILANLSPHARLLFISFWMLADREGRLENKPAVIKGMVFPFEPKVNIVKLTDELAKHGFIAKYGPTGEEFVVVLQFLAYQKVHPNEAKSVIPPPPEDVIKCNVIKCNVITKSYGPLEPVGRGRGKGKDKEEEEGRDTSPYETEIVEIVDDLNSLIGANYKSATKSIRTDITARIRDGYTVDNFKHVHRVKWAEWHGTDQEQYVRPKTLYNATNFPNYVNQKIKLEVQDDYSGPPRV